MNIRPTLVKRTVHTLWACSLLGSAAIQADTYVFEAVSDFPVIDAGEVPYYSEAPGRASLAINAAIEDYRNKFARATMRYEGDSDFYDITLTGLAELDGEAQYRVLVNDVLVGTASNPEVDVDYTPVRHTFEDIVVPNGATVAVESLANTNGKIPEGDGTAYARGRWTSLEFDNGQAGSTPDDDVDLVLNASIDNTDIHVGDVFTLTFEILNSDGSAVATSPRLALTRPRAEVALASESVLDCLESDNDLICELSEIAAGDTRTVSVSLQALSASPSLFLRVTATTDQTELTPDNNVLSLPLSITDSPDDSDVQTPEPEPTDQPDNAQSVDGTTGSEQPEVTPDTASPSSSSGGGAPSLWMLLVLSGIVIRRRQR